MALLESVKLPLGTAMPDFQLNDPFNKPYTGRESVGENGIMVVFTCNHCPYALAVWPRIIRLAKYAQEEGITTLAINPNIHPSYPEDAPGEMKKKIEEWDLEFPYLIDETQQTARDFKAQCTPDIYLFDRDRKLVYHGRVDDNWQDEDLVTREELRAAVDALASGEPVDPAQSPSIGCSIKWRN